MRANAPLTEVRMHDILDRALYKESGIIIYLQQLSSVCLRLETGWNASSAVVMIIVSLVATGCTVLSATNMFP